MNLVLTIFLLIIVCVNSSFSQAWEIYVGRYNKSRAYELVEILRNNNFSAYMDYTKNPNVYVIDHGLKDEVVYKRILIENLIGVNCLLFQRDAKHEFRKRNEAKIIKVVNNALELLNKPYIFGEKTGIAGFDCSGFVKRVFENVGVNLPESSLAQSLSGREIPVKLLSRGDLVYFKDHDFYNNPVSHIGIYLGNGDFIHSEMSSGKVEIDNLMENSYYRKIFTGVRRVIE